MSETLFIERTERPDLMNASTVLIDTPLPVSLTLCGKEGGKDGKEGKEGKDGKENECQLPGAISSGSSDRARAFFAK